MRVLIVTCIAVGYLASCTSDYEVKQVDTKLDVKGRVGSSTLGLNEENEAILQDNNRADAALSDFIFDNNRLESEIKYEYYEIKRCRKDRADPRLGGSGNTVPLPKVDFNRPTPSSEELGLDEKGDLIILKRAMFNDKLKNERSKNENLHSVLAKVRELKEDCELHMGRARVKAGLPSERFQGEVDINSDGTVRKTINAHEKNLDDAFRIMKIKQKMEAREED